MPPVPPGRAFSHRLRRAKFGQILHLLDCRALGIGAGIAGIQPCSTSVTQHQLIGGRSPRLPRRECVVVASAKTHRWPAVSFSVAIGNHPSSAAAPGCGWRSDSGREARITAGQQHLEPPPRATWRAKQPRRAPSAGLAKAGGGL